MTMVKICGITNLPDALAAAEAGADLLGFIFYPPSPRYIQPELARDIIWSLGRLYATRTVGVFVNEPAGAMQKVIIQCGLDLVQLSGDETPQIVRELTPRAYKSLRPRDLDELEHLVRYYAPIAQGNMPALLIDAFNPKLYGGTGERVDWVLARKLARRFSILLAGGLTPENVADAVQIVEPWGLDVSSGVERAPGIKDHDKVRLFVKRAKGELI